MGALRGAVARGGDLPAALEGAAGALPESVRDVLHGAARRLRGEYAQDEWGFDEEFVEIVYPLFEFMYERWWRVNATGVEHVPAHDRALLVANHAGVLPWDATMMSVAIQKNHPLPRHPRFMVLDWAFRLPWVSAFMRRVGGVVASPYNAIRLLEQGHLVMVFPEGSKGAGKPFSERYRLQRFGRGGFVEIALRTGAPIVPVAIVGSEEIYPKLGESRAAGPPDRRSLLPDHADVPRARPRSAPCRCPRSGGSSSASRSTCARYGPEAAEDRSLVFELSERVRETIQSTVYENLARARLGLPLDCLSPDIGFSSAVAASDGRDMRYFVTGATGFIGRHLVERLLEREGTIHVLVREGSRARLEELMSRWGAEQGRIVPVIGDLTAPELGVSDADRKAARRASTTSSTSPRSTTCRPTRRPTGERTSRAPATRSRSRTRSARGASTTPARSRCRVATAALFREDMFDEGQKLADPYSRTKFESEKIVREECDVPWRVYRPGIVVGHSQTGEMDKVDGPYYFFKVIQRLRGLAAAVDADRRARGRPDQHRARSTSSPRRWTTSPTRTASTAARSTSPTRTRRPPAR